MKLYQFIRPSDKGDFTKKRARIIAPAHLLVNEIKKAGSVLLSHGRVPHYPRRWSP